MSDTILWFPSDGGLLTDLKFAPIGSRTQALEVLLRSHNQAMNPIATRIRKVISPNYPSAVKIAVGR